MTTQQSNDFSKYFKVLDEPYKNDKPCLPDKEMIIEIPQNLPQGTQYNIGLQNENSNIPIGEKLDIINQKLNNIIEVNSLLLLKYLPEIHEQIKHIHQLIKQIKKKPEIKDIKPPLSW